ncbi:MAG: hypothetical protein M3310_04980 [Actinomycetota bacterium]|nr:hypothetical protein [Actinomycetota bacterium]
MPLFRRRKDESRLRQIGEAEAYGRSYGDASGDVKIVKVEPRRPRYQLNVSGESLRNAFLERLNKRDPSDRPGDGGT